MKILITGSAGFVGQHFWRHLEADHALVGLDIVNGADVRQIDDWLHPGARFDLVIHCAAVVGGRRTIDGSPLAVASNLGIDQALFEWVEHGGADRVLYLSSSAAYPVIYQEGRPGQYRLSEDDVDLNDPRLPDQTYGWAKLTGEQLAQHVTVPVHIVRPFSGMAEDQSLDYPFPSFAKRAREHADPFEVWGSGAQCRDWIHVSDVVAGAMAVVNQDVQVPVNLGTGRATSFFDLAEMFMEEAGYRGEIKTMPGEPSGVMFRVADTTRMESIYKPKVSLEEAIARAVAA